MKISDSLLETELSINYTPVYAVTTFMILMIIST